MNSKWYTTQRAHAHKQLHCTEHNDEWQCSMWRYSSTTTYHTGGRTHPRRTVQTDMVNFMVRCPSCQQPSLKHRIRTKVPPKTTGLCKLVWSTGTSRRNTRKTLQSWTWSSRHKRKTTHWIIPTKNFWWKKKRLCIKT